MPKKRKLFSGRGYNPRGSVKRAEKKLLKGIFSVPDITMISLEDARDLKAFIKSRRKRITTSGNDYPSEIARVYNLLGDTLTDDPLELLDQYNAQEFYFEQLQIEAEARQNEDIKPLMEADDKWLILRRLATEDLMLNLDRAYASETLKTIEDLIEAHKGEMTYQELADALLSGKFEEYQFDRAHPEDGLKPFASPNPFDIESQALTRNRGFHGVAKAMSKWERDRKNRTDRVRTGLTGFAPVWIDPDDLSN